MNKVFLTGNLTRDIEMRYTQNGTAVASFSIGNNEKHGDKQMTTFVPIVAWDKIAEVCGSYLSKGSKILVEGRIQIRNYEGKDGIKRYVTEVIAQNIEFMDSKKQPNNNDPTGMGTEVYPEEEVPF